MEPFKELPEEDMFVWSVMQSYVFSIARQVSYSGLFLWAPRNHPRSECKAVATNRLTGINTVGVVRIWMVTECDGIVATKHKGM